MIGAGRDCPASGYAGQNFAACCFCQIGYDPRHQRGTQSAVSAGMAKALADMVISGVALNRITGPGALGGWRSGQQRGCYQIYKRARQESGIELVIPTDHEFINALGYGKRGPVFRKLPAGSGN